MRNSTPLLCYVDLLAETALTSSDVKGECSGEPGDNLVTTLYFSLYSSEEEEIKGDDFEDVNVDRNMEHEAEDQGIEATSQGTENVVDKLPMHISN